MGADEGFFLRAVLWSLLELEFWTMPVTAVLGALTKEPFIPFCILYGCLGALKPVRQKCRQRANSSFANRDLDPEQLGAGFRSSSRIAGPELSLSSGLFRCGFPTSSGEDLINAARSAVILDFRQLSLLALVP